MIVRDKIIEPTTNSNVGPGRYNISEISPSVMKRSSFNFGQIPFGTSNERFQKPDYYTRPGPGSYEVNSAGMTSSFKSKIPKISLYQDMEKRNLSYNGNRKQTLKYKLKVNDVILDSEDLNYKNRGNSNTPPGKIKKGNVLLIKPQSTQEGDQQEKSQFLTQKVSSNTKQNDLFGVKKMNPTGPGDYDVNANMLYKAAPISSFSITGRYKKDSLKKQMESYLQSILGQNAVQDKARNLITQIETENPQFNMALNEKPLSSMVSKTIYKNPLIKKDIPGPADYKPGQPKYKIDSMVDKGFGSTVKRDSLFQRDIAHSPFKDPTRIINPSPDNYQKENNKSLNLRISRDATILPGPGKYEIQSSKNNSFQDPKFYQTKYSTKPFNSTAMRFKNSQSVERDQDNDDVFNSAQLSNSVVLKKKQAIREAINMIKEFQANKESSTFKSRVQRFQEGGSEDKRRQIANQTISDLSTMNINKNRDLIQNDKQYFTGSRYSSVGTRHQAGFISQSPRYSFVMTEARKSETPGPGHYIQNQLKDYEDQMKQTGVAAFKTITRNKQSYMLQNGGATHQVGPGAYDIEKSFTKQSFNQGRSPKKVFL